MTQNTQLELDGTKGRIVVHKWADTDPRFVVLLAHGYGEHAGRYAHVAERLVAEGAVVYAPDHLGHGRSDGERALIEDIEDVLADLEAVDRLARAEHSGLPVVLIGHSMGGVIATRYIQTRSPELRALVLSGPVIGGNSAMEPLLGMDPIPEIPIDPAVLSRDEEVGRAYADDALVYHGPFKKPTLEALFGAIHEIPEGPGLGTLPTLWIHGDEDALAPLEETRSTIERIRGETLEERIYPGARHEVFNETNRDEVIGDVITFVRREVVVTA
jgi:alpha-beta hydrolase superfamily lysophospholipase